MKTSPKGILAHLRGIAPDIAISIAWEEDPNYVWDGDGPDPQEEGYVPHDVFVYARAIIQGALVEGENNLGGVYARPGEKDPDISGYFPQMVQEALDELAGSVPAGHLHAQAKAGIGFLDAVLKERYEEQRSRK